METTQDTKCKCGHSKKFHDEETFLTTVPPFYPCIFALDCGCEGFEEEVES